IIEKASNSAWVGCSCVPSPALIIWAFTFWDRKWADPGEGCRNTIISTFMAMRLLMVSSSVSPLLTDEEELLKLIISAESLFSASSKDKRVRVEFSKKALAMVRSRRDGTFFIGWFICSLNRTAVDKINRISSTVKSLIPIRCLTLNPVSIVQLAVIGSLLTSYFSLLTTIHS